MNIMKSLLSLFVIALGMLLAVACENEPRHISTYITSPEVMAKVSEGLQGTYTGKLIVVMDDTTSHIMHNADGTWVRQPFVDSVPNFTYTVSPLLKGNGSATAHVVLPNFPIRWLARSISNREIREALKESSVLPLELDYELRGETYAPNSHNGYLRAKSLPLEFDVSLAGKPHSLTLEFHDVMDLAITADAPDSWRVSVVQMNVSKVLLDGEILEIFDNAWTDAPSPTFFISLRGNKVL